jgi:predicted kinase
MGKPMLYLMLGYPGAGKTTVAKIIHKLTGAVHIWEDQERLKHFQNPVFSQAESDELHNLLNTRTGELLSAGKSVIYDTSFNAYEDRKRMYRIADACYVDTELIWVNTAKEIAHQRATQDTISQPTRVLATVLGDMDEETFKRLTNKLQPPADNEPYITIDGTNVNEAIIRKKLRL